MTLDTACSTSLVAMHLGATAIQNKECVPSGVVCVSTLSEDFSVSFAGGGMLSAFGRCHTLDKRADGYARGESSCAVLFSDAAAKIVIVDMNAVRGSAV